MKIFLFPKTFEKIIEIRIKISEVIKTCLKKVDELKC